MSVSLVSRNAVYGTASGVVLVVLPTSVVRPAIAAASCVGELAAPARPSCAARPSAKHAVTGAFCRVLEARVTEPERNAQRLVETVTA